MPTGLFAFTYKTNPVSCNQRSYVTAHEPLEMFPAMIGSFHSFLFITMNFQYPYLRVYHAIYCAYNGT